MRRIGHTAAAVAPRRRPGRSRRATPPARNAGETRERILRAAIAEFAAKGYSGARVDGICRAARANPRMIYHYFGGKAALYLAILEHVLGELRREELKLDVDHVAPFDGILQLFDFIHDHFGAHPELISLLMGENLLRAEFLRRSRKTPVISSPLLGLIAGLLERGAAEGVLRAGIDPLQLYVAMVASSSYHRSNGHTLSVIFSTDLLDPRWQAAQKQQAREALACFLQAPAVTSSG
ncbi:MAG: TetR/AcrR family transcriptional regulator [Stellaceae bacterium]